MIIIRGSEPRLREVVAQKMHGLFALYVMQSGPELACLIPGIATLRLTARGIL